MTERERETDRQRERERERERDDRERERERGEKDVDGRIARRIPLSSTAFSRLRDNIFSNRIISLTMETRWY